MNSRQAIAFGTLALLWGSSFLFIKVLITAGVSPIALAAARTALGFAVILPVAWHFRDAFPRDRRTLRFLVLLGLLNFAIPWTLFGVGQQFTPSAAGSIVNATNPLWAAVFAVPLLPSERLTRGRLLGLLSGFLGVALLMFERIEGFDRESLLGIPPMLLATICYAVSAVMIRRFLPEVPAIPLSAGQLGVAMLSLVPVALLTRGFEGADFGWQEWASLFALGCVGSGAGTLVYMWLLGEIGPVRSAVVTYLMSPMGVFLGWLLLDESITWALAAGLVLILAGVAIVQFERVFWPSPERAPRRAAEQA